MKRLKPSCEDATVSENGSEIKEHEANDQGDMCVLEESDIPGASLNGKKPCELNVAQLKRWLSCRGAPVTGKKAELIERVECYIRFGWDHLLVDPDRGLNSQKKLANLAGEKLELDSFELLQSLPRPSDQLWTKSLIGLPKITFSTIYKFTVERKVPQKKVSYLEDLADIRAQMSVNKDTTKESVKDLYMQTEYTRTLDKGYRFFQDGHVQDVKCHPLPHKPNFVYVASTVLPSMKKDCVYHVNIVVGESPCSINTAYCTCPAGLSGCCNHVIATLYCLEDYIHQGLQDEEKKGCTERLQVWNQPRLRNVIGRPTDEVKLTKKVYGVEKRPKLYTINKWDCRPLSRRIIDPNKARRLRERLCTIQKEKVEAADKVVHSGGTVSELKKAVQAKLLINMYGTSGYLQMLDDEAPPLESRNELLRKERNERLSRAAEKKRKFQEDLAVKQLLVLHDHKYTSLTMDKQILTENPKNIGQVYHLVRYLYVNHVCINPTAIHELEMRTRSQADSQLWHHERTLRITASMIKEVCSKKDSTSCKPFILKKLLPTPIDTAAIRYGKRHEQCAIESYKNYCKLNGVQVVVEPCGLFVDSLEPWLAASPDGIILEPSQCAMYSKGCLEVKCPFLCKQKLIADVCREKASFCIEEKNGKMYLSTSHSYYYQIQTQMHVTKLPWCDFVVWSPVDDPFVQRVYYNSQFMKEVISKARSFYFNIYLPSIVPCVIISNSTDLLENVKPMENVRLSDQVKAMDNVKLFDSVKLSGNVKLSDSAKVIDNVKPLDSVKPANVVKPLDSVKPADGVKLLDSVKDMEDVKAAFDGTMLQVVASCKHKTIPLSLVLKELNLARHSVYGDGSCLYHSIAHQAGFIAKTSCGDNIVSNNLRQLVYNMMTDHPNVRLEEGMSVIQWLEKKQRVMDPAEWGGDMEVRLLAIGLHRDIVVITASSTSDGSYARFFPCKPPPLPKMSGGIFIPLTCDELCAQWQSTTPRPLVIIFNGFNHYDSTILL